MEIRRVTEFYLEENGPVRGSLLICRHFLDSVLEQRICFYSHTARIDFKTKADWRESQLLLRTSFPLIYRAMRQILRFSLEM